MIKDVLRKAVFSLTVVGALGFGTSQAVAAPRAAASMACDTQGDLYCRNLCQEFGYDTGVCDYRYQWGCRCWNW